MILITENERELKEKIRKTKGLRKKIIFQNDEYYVEETNQMIEWEMFDYIKIKAKYIEEFIVDFGTEEYKNIKKAIYKNQEEEVINLIKSVIEKNKEKINLAEFHEQMCKLIQVTAKNSKEWGIQETQAKLRILLGFED